MHRPLTHYLVKWYFDKSFGFSCDNPCMLNICRMSLTFPVLYPSTDDIGIGIPISGRHARRIVEHLFSGRSEIETAFWRASAVKYFKRIRFFLFDHPCSLPVFIDTAIPKFLDLLVYLVRFPTNPRKRDFFVIDPMQISHWPCLLKFNRQSFRLHLIYSKYIGSITSPDIRIPDGYSFLVRGWHSVTNDLGLFTSSHI